MSLVYGVIYNRQAHYLANEGQGIRTRKGSDTKLQSKIIVSLLLLPYKEMMPVRQTLSLPDIQLSYLEWNQGQEPLLLLHGLGDHAGVWSSLGERVASDYHIVAPDMRGHGESSKPDRGYIAVLTQVRYA